ncbi:MAG: MFS transporter [Coriobacteriaceae bacterium]|jgi:sugar phosphate permease|nr:MFS transporter [Coriobacteriaceae bacterium]
MAARDEQNTPGAEQGTRQADVREAKEAETATEQGHKQGRFFYGWWIVVGGFLIMATCYTVFINCIPLFQENIVNDLKISMGDFNTGVSLCTVLAIVASLVIGPLAEKRSVRVLGSITVIVTFIILVLFSFMDQLWQLYALCVVAGMVVVAGTRLFVSVLTTNWFTLKRGLAVSIALAGSGFGGVALTEVTTRMLEGPGWRPAFLVLAFICLVVALPITAIMFRNRPSSLGLEPYGVGQTEAAKPDRSPDKPVTVSVGWRFLRKSGGFWLLILGLVMMGIVNGAVITNAVTNMKSVELDGVLIVLGGHSPEWAGRVWMLYLAMVIVGKVVLGALYDRFGMKAGTLVGSAACLLAGIALCFPATDIAPILAALFFGFGTCMGTVTPPIMVVKEYGKKDLGLVTGVATAFELLGAAVGAVVSGRLFDAFHSFVPAWLMVIAASAAMGALLLLSIPAARKIVATRITQGAPLLDAEGFEIA